MFGDDPLGQLTSFTRSDGQSESYAYDPVGNMTAKTQNGVSTTMRYNAANQLIQSVSGTDKITYSYDANGNLTRSENAAGARSYAYNALNLLESFTREDGYTETYSYNANRLLSKIRTSEDLTTTLTWDILYGDGVVISADQNGKSTNYTYGLERISAISGSTRTEYVYDGRGSVAAEVSYNNAWYTFGGGLARKNVTAKSYTPFGEQIGEAASGFGYNGEYYNAATGMIYLRARFYEPEMNRFSQKDTLRGSIADPVGLNRYLYCQSDPVNYADYNGLQMVNVCVADGGGSGRDNSRYARTTASSTTASNQPPTFQEYLAQNNYDPFNPLSRLSTTGSNNASGRQSQGTSSTSQTSGITQASPSVQDVTGNRGYSCGRDINALGAGDYGAYSLGATWNRIVDWARSDKGQKALLTTLSVLEIAGGVAITIATGGTASILLTAAAGALTGGGFMSLISGYGAETQGGNFTTGWIGGEISGTLTGAGIGAGGGIFKSLALQSGATATQAASGLILMQGVSGIGGFAGGYYSSEYMQNQSSGEIDKDLAIRSGEVSGFIAATSWPFEAVSSALGAAGIGGTVFSIVEELIFDYSSYYAGQSLEVAP